MSLPPPTEDTVIADFLPVIAALAGPGRIAIGIGGSRAKGRTDPLSDYDFRLYADAFAGPDVHATPEYAAFSEVMQRWEARGIHIDGTWPRLIGQMDAELDDWCAGRGRATDLDWAIWGYHLPTDLFHQRILHDPDGVMAGWKARLTPYPKAMRVAILTRNMALLRYWAQDYHYESKVQRGDTVFLASLAARLVHAILQVVYAVNRTYYPGDGWNLSLARDLPVQPSDLAARIETILTNCPPDPARQRAAIVALVADLEPLVDI